METSHRTLSGYPRLIKLQPKQVIIIIIMIIMKLQMSDNAYQILAILKDLVCVWHSLGNDLKLRLL